MRLLLTLAARHKNRQIVKLIMDYNVNNNNPHLNLLTNEAIETAVESNDVDFLSFLLDNSNRPHDAKHHIILGDIEMSNVDYQLFKVMMRHLHDFHFPQPIQLGGHKQLLESIGSQENAHEFITSVGVLRDCGIGSSIPLILKDILNQYFSLELLEHIHQTLPECFSNVNWLSRPVCTSPSRYLTYLEFRRTRTGMKENSHHFVFAIMNFSNYIDRDHLALLQLVRDHFIDTGKKFSIWEDSISAAIYLGCPLEVIKFLMDFKINELHLIIRNIHPSLQSMELFQLLAARYPNISYGTDSLNSLLLSGNFELYHHLIGHMQRLQKQTIDYNKLLNSLANLQPHPEVTSIITSLIHNHLSELLVVDSDVRQHFLLNPCARETFISALKTAQSITTTTPTPPFTLGDLSTFIFQLKIKVPLASERVEMFQQLLDSDLFAPWYRRPIQGYPMNDIIHHQLFELLPVLGLKYPNAQLAYVKDDCFGTIKRVTMFGLSESFKVLITHPGHNRLAFLKDANLAFENLDIIQFLCSNNIYFNISESFLRAARTGKLETIEYLVEKQKVLVTTKAMDEAAKKGNHQVVEYLHNNRTEGYLDQAFIGAARDGHHDVLEYLFSMLQSKQDMVSMDTWGTMTRYAMEYGHVLTLQAIINNRTNIGTIIKHNEPSLFHLLALPQSLVDHSLKLSIIQGHLNLVSYFLNKKYDMTFQ
ncbi:hypothetical protein SAMD00019534_055370 [Acytostelium subglobosum LB1]|uniref:hypothetical protein n=1 Tax=Acytostelium subglobosum LB1 TaxID=1410327 RepID=UPI000644A87F|nr:hypothetical protein SAMD00019534_055370 [Acytostelium subglobosum LB1]GAM22362.1 hypothetical protein SAMD00019534_055370 [Acytostelium subglobosum LB1]|eukprot:XP_012754482.1 hypothetical protein SAMD00019534_055370 [Acytostelium subglobosum LB1]